MALKKLYLTTLICLLFFCSYIKGQEEELFEGSSCRTKDNRQGACAKISDCKEIENGLRRGLIPYSVLTRCLFIGDMEVICCPGLTPTITTPSHRPDRIDTDTIIFNFNPDDYNDVSPSPNPRVDNDNKAGEKSKTACARYSKDVTAGLTFHILNGIPTVPGEFPHMAALGYPSLGGGEDILWDCGGSLISETFVLTAGHCAKVDRQPTIIRLGKITLVTTDDNLDAVDVTISEIILHPEYRASRQYNDIALLKLSQNVEFNEYIRPACLYTETTDVDPNIPVIVTGWGSTSTKSRIKSQFLLKVNLTTVPVQTCNQSHVEYGLNRRYPNGLNDGQLCAFDPGLEKDACEGDSGGPLQLVDKNGISTVVGVTSFGISCATSIPGVYARVAFYLQWIESVVW